MSQSRMLQIRRKKQKAKKRLARMVKQAKKLRQQNVKKAGADGLKKISP